MPKKRAPLGPQSAIPNKPYFRIGEVARLVGVETHVLRYWESEFPQFEPLRAPGGQRVFHRPHVETARLIKTLLHEQGYTVKGARARLDELAQDGTAPPQDGGGTLDELKAILEILH